MAPVDDIVEEAAHDGLSKVVVRVTTSGTQTGPVVSVAPSGTPAESTGIGIYDVRAGKITEAWFGEGILGMLLQPAPPTVKS